MILRCCGLQYALLVSRTRTNFGDRAFSAAGPQSLELSADGPQTAGLVIQPFQIQRGFRGVFLWSVAPQRSVNLHVTALYKHCYLTCMGRCTFTFKLSEMKRDTLIPRLSQTAQKPNCAPPPMRLAVV